MNNSSSKLAISIVMALKQNKILVGNLNEEMKIIDKKIIKIIEKSLAGSGMIPNPEMK